jgi:hypothetical protein
VRRRSASDPILISRPSWQLDQSAADNPKTSQAKSLSGSRIEGRSQCHLQDCLMMH